MHALLLPRYFLGLALGHMIVHPKVRLPSASRPKASLHEFLIGSVSHALVTAIVAPVLALSGVLVVVIPAVGFVLTKRKGLIEVDLIGWLIRATNNKNAEQ